MLLAEKKSKHGLSSKELELLAERFLLLCPPTPSQKRLSELKQLKALRRQPLSQVYPEIAEDWLFELNKGYSPDDFNHCSNFRAWWCCPNGPDHIYEQKIAYHVKAFREESSTRGCPFCRNLLVSVTNSLAACFPDIASEWDAKRNGRTADSVVASTNEPGWFICAFNRRHRWKTRVSHRTTGNGTGCPFCVNRAVSTENSLSTLFPAVSREFHPTKNKGKTPDTLLASGTDRIWWQCSKNKRHVWQSEIYLRTLRGTGCRVCREEKAERRKTELASRPEQKFHSIAKNASKIAQCVEQGMTYNEVADKFGVSLSTVVKIMILARGRVKNMPNNDSKERKQVRRLLDKGLTYRETAKRLKISYYKVALWADSKVNRAARDLQDERQPEGRSSPERKHKAKRSLS